MPAALACARARSDSTDKVVGAPAYAVFGLIDTFSCVLCSEARSSEPDKYILDDYKTHAARNGATKRR